MVGDFLLQLLDCFDSGKVDVQRKRLLFGGGFEVKLDHLKKYQIVD